MIRIPIITVNQDFNSVFSEEIFNQSNKGGMYLTERLNAENFRLRSSLAGYSSDWHVAGDPTLIIVQSGTLRIALHSGHEMDFHSGDMFIAKDYLPESITFNPAVHGHRALVLGNKKLTAVHIKLEQLQ